MRHSLPLFLSNDPAAGAKNVSADGSTFSVALQPPIAIPSRQRDGTPAVATIRCDSVDVVNSFRNVMASAHNNTVIVGRYTGGAGLLTATVATKKTKGGTTLVLNSFVGADAIDPETHVHLTTSKLGTSAEKIVVRVGTITVPAEVGANITLVFLGNSDFAADVGDTITFGAVSHEHHTITLGDGAYSIADIGAEVAHAATEVSANHANFSLSMSADVLQNRARLSFADGAFDELCFSPLTLHRPTVSVPHASISSWPNVHKTVTISATVGQSLEFCAPGISAVLPPIAISHRFGISAVTIAPLTLPNADTVEIVTDFQTTDHIWDQTGGFASYDNASTYFPLVTPQGTREPSLSTLKYMTRWTAFDTFVVAHMPTNLQHWESHMYVLQDDRGDVLGFHFCVKKGASGAALSGHSLLLGLGGRPVTYVDVAGSDHADNVFHHLANIRADAPVQHADVAKLSSPYGQYMAYDLNDHWVHITSATVMEDAANTFVFGGATHTFPFKDTTAGNGLALLTGFVVLDASGKVTNYKQYGHFTGDLQYKDRATFRRYTAPSPARLDQASVINLGVSCASGSIMADGHGQRQVIASFPISAGAGYHQSFQPSQPIRCRTNLAGFKTDQLSFSLRDVLGTNLHLGGERYCLTLVIEWED